jgi:branched-chain amino acid transport system ATP-binding protein
MTELAPAPLVVRGLAAGYHRVPVLEDIDVDVAPGEVVALLGPNGAGKTTLLKALTGTLPLTRGTVVLGDTRIDGGSPGRAAKLGLAHVPEGRRVFGGRTIADNLLLGAWVRRHDRSAVLADRDAMYQRFPILGARARQRAGALSGGEAQMLSIAMALMARPRVVLFDEPSLGLAPLIVDQVLDQIDRLRADGLAVLLVEQNVAKSLQVADRGYVLSLGRITLEGSADELRQHPDVQRAYLGR